MYQDRDQDRDRDTQVKLGMMEHLLKEVDYLLAGLVGMSTVSNADVLLECGAERFYCHAPILRARSSVFEELLNQENKHIKIDGVHEDVMSKIIKYIYTNKADITDRNLVPMIIGAFKFNLELLLEQCFSFFRTQLSLSLNFEVLIIAQKLNINAFKSVALDKLIKNRKTIIQDQALRNKMREHPDGILLMFDKMCEDDGPEVMNPEESHHNQDANRCAPPVLWTCLCGATVIGQFCSWCGYIPQ